MNQKLNRIFEQTDKNPRSDTDHKLFFYQEITNLVDLSTYYNDVLSDSNNPLIVVRIETLMCSLFISYATLTKIIDINFNYINVPFYFLK